ncbi:MAG: D-alanyl-D-alanine carboxypeptidase family protein [Bdellovibrionales bacterium]
MKHFLILLVASISLSCSAYATTIETSAKQAIVMDYDTKQVLFEKNADEKMPTSSMSKVITTYAIISEIKKGNLNLEDQFLVSEKAWKKGGSKMFVEVNKKVSIKDLLKGVIIQSGNDATIVLAEGLAGTEEDFARHLNKIAQKLGMENSNFVNASGWPDENHYSTARDLATLAYHTIKDFPEFYGYYAEKEFTYNNITQTNRNPLLSLDIGADGIKTGHTEIAGYGLMASALSSKDGRRVIVVFNGTDSMKSRAEEAEKLVLWGLNGFKNKVFLNEETDLYKVPVLFGKQEFVQAGVEDSLTLTIEKLAEDDFKSAFKAKPDIQAPISVGDIVGTIEITKSGKPFKTVDVVAKSSVEELGAVKKFFAKTKHRFKNKD